MSVETQAARPPRPVPLEVIHNNIPAELKAPDQWLLWRYKWIEKPGKEGKWDKPPYQAYATELRLAASTDPGTWSTFGMALATYEVATRDSEKLYDGMGFVPKRTDPYVFGDLDHCRDPETGAIEEWAQQIVNDFATYTEVSPSGTGLRFFTKGIWPTEEQGGVNNRKLGIELYSYSHYLTVTGQHLLGTSFTIEERSAQIAALYKRIKPEPVQASRIGAAHSPIVSDEEIIEAGLREKSDKFRSLWAGDISSYPSASEADIALACKLAYYTQDAGQIERLMFSSRLVRDKWGRQTYIRPTIDNALRRVTKVYVWPQVGNLNGNGKHSDNHSAGTGGASAESNSKPFKDVFTTAQAVAESTSELVEWVARPWLTLGGITEIDGRIKGGKTTWVLAMCRAILDGLPFMGHPTRPGPVVYLTEQPTSSFREALRRADLLERDDFYILFWGAVTHLTWEQKVGIAVQKALEVGAETLVVDTLAWWAGLRGDAENNSGHAATAMEPLASAAQNNPLGIALLRHERKGGGEVGDSARGSSAFGGSVDIVIAIKRLEGNPGAGPNMRVLKSLSRYDETPAELTIELTDDGYITHGDLHAVEYETARKAILEALQNNAGRTEKELLADCAAHKVKRSTLQGVLQQLLSEGLAVRTGEGKRGKPYVHSLVGLVDDAETGEAA